MFLDKRSRNYERGETCISYEDFFKGYFESELEQKLEAVKEEKLSFIVECDISAPQDLHEFLEDFPIPAEKYKVSDLALSKLGKMYKKDQNYNKPLSDSLASSSTPSKLCLTLIDKEKYKTTLENLLLLTEMGLKVTRLHRVLQSTSSPFLEKWVLHNTRMRNEAKKNGNVYLDLFYKLVVNATFGKLCENLKGAYLIE